MPCLTIRENTERPVTIENGTNTLVGTDTQKILETSKNVLKLDRQEKKKPKLWDGMAAARICRALLDWKSLQKMTSS